LNKKPMVGLIAPTSDDGIVELS